MAWHRRPEVVRVSRPQRRVPESVWHPCGHCAAGYCPKRSEISKRSLASLARKEQIADCGDRVVPYFERFND
jgi:hypothetical protein